MKFPGLIWLLFLLYMYSCQSSLPEYITLDGQAQGTTFHITYRDSLQRDFSTPVDSLFRLIDRSMSLWDTSSVISRINRNEPNVIPDEHFKIVFNQAREISKLTGGAFDVTVGPLIKAWGISSKNKLPFPDSAAVDSLKLITGFEKVNLVGDQIVKADPRIALDFNAIAQGYTVDLISGFLMQQGIHDFLVEIGGEVYVTGVNERGDTWQVGIDKPTETATEGRPLQTSISLRDLALATSGSYRKYLVKDGKKLSHVIDPASGYPVSTNLLSVSVKAGDCTSADAYATAFLVMGVEKSMALARERKMDVYFIFADSTGNLAVKATPGFSN